MTGIPALEGMPTHFQQESLYADEFAGPGEVTIGPINYRAANLSAGNQLAKSMNQQVTVIYGGILPEEQARIKGTLLALHGNTALLRLSDGKIQDVRNVQGFIYSGLVAGLANTPALDKAKFEYVVRQTAMEHVDTRD